MRGRDRINARAVLGVLALTLAGLVGAAALATPAVAHEERHAEFPAGDGKWIQKPRTYDADRPHLVVCQPDSARRIAEIDSTKIRKHNRKLLKQCDFNSIQDAVDAVKKRKTDIWILPGLYTEAHLDGEPKGACANLQPAPDNNFVGQLTDPTNQPDYTGSSPVALSYRDQRRCPHNLNLVAIFGDKTPVDVEDETPETIKCDTALCGVQLAGTGESPYDVVLDNRFSKLNAIRADRVDGVIFSNFTVQRAEFNSIYIMETDGFLIDRTVTRANEEYGLLTFASDHGIYQHNESYFNGDSGIYPGAASDVNYGNLNFPVKRYAIEVRHNNSHDNNLGYSGTAGNSVWVHHNKFHHNGTGIVTDSFFPNHPGLPQDHARFGPANKIYSNNQNYYAWHVFSDDPVCDKPIEERGYLEKGVVCPATLAPVGSGIMIGGGNFNSVDNNQIYDNWRYGTLQVWVPAALRNEANPLYTYDTSNNNHYFKNRLAQNPKGPWRQPNGIDFYWDEQGSGNCWRNNTSVVGDPTTNAVLPSGLPDTCTNDGQGVKVGDRLVSTNPGTAAFQDATFLSCTQYSRTDTDPVSEATCEWYNTPSPPAGRQGPAYSFTPYKAPFLDDDHVAPLNPPRNRPNPNVGNPPASGPGTPGGGNSLAATGGGIGLAALGLVALVGAFWVRRRRHA